MDDTGNTPTGEQEPSRFPTAAEIRARDARGRAMELAVTAWSGTDVSANASHFCVALRYTAGQIYDWIENGPEESY